MFQVNKSAEPAAMVTSLQPLFFMADSPLFTQTCLILISYHDTLTATATRAHPNG